MIRSIMRTINNKNQFPRKNGHSEPMLDNDENDDDGDNDDDKWLSVMKPYVKSWELPLNMRTG